MNIERFPTKPAHPDAEPAPATHGRETGRLWTWAIAALLLAALVLRLHSIAFGLPSLNNQDEMMFELGALRMLRGPTLNPGWFGHPATTTMYVLAFVDIGALATAFGTGAITSVKQFGALVYSDPTWIVLPGRIAMCLFALGTIWLVYRLANRLFDRPVALLAAALLAVNPIHVTYSQIIRSDMMACFFMLLCLLACLNIVERARWRDHMWASLWLGVAVATKWPFALAGLPILGAVLFNWRDGRIGMRQAAVRLVGVGVMAPSFLLLASPYIAIDYPTLIRNLAGEGQAHHLGATGHGFGSNALWYLGGPIADGMGWVGLVLVLIGLPALVRRREALVLMLPLAIAFFIVLCAQTLIWERWALPLMPVGVIVAALGIRTVARLLPPPIQWPALALILAIAIVPLALKVRADDRVRLDDTRQRASAWGRRHIAPGSTVLVEHLAIDLVNEPWHILFPLAELGCVDAVGLLRNKISYRKIDMARGGRSNVDYGTLPPRAWASCRADYAILTQYDRYRAERADFPQEYDAYRRMLARGKVVAEMKPVEGRTGGPVVTIVRFPPMGR